MTQASPAQTYDAILILGGGIHLDGGLPETAKVYIREAVRLYGVYSPYAFITAGLHGYKSEEKPVVSEAKAYAHYAESLGVPTAAIFLEERSQETLGNILFTKMNILIPNGWNRLLVIPQVNHLTERVEYLLQKVLGPTYEWTIVHPLANLSADNVTRESKSLSLTRQINDAFEDGDHDAIYKGLMESHPAYGGTLQTVEELRRLVG